MAVSARETKPLVVIAARQPSRRARMRLALESSATCIEADGAAAAVDAVARDKGDACFLDAGSGGGGIDAARLIRQLQPEAKVILIAHRLSEEEFLQAVQAGAAGYLSDELDPTCLPAIVAAVLRGEPAVPRLLVRRLVDEVRSMGKRTIALDDNREVTLTRREAQVLDLLRDGLPTHAIAHRLGVTNVTVRRHRSALFSKLDIRPNNDVREAGIQLLDNR